MIEKEKKKLKANLLKLAQIDDVVYESTKDTKYIIIKTTPLSYISPSGVSIKLGRILIRIKIDSTVEDKERINIVSMDGACKKCDWYNNLYIHPCIVLEDPMSSTTKLRHTICFGGGQTGKDVYKCLSGEKYFRIVIVLLDFFEHPNYKGPYIYASVLKKRFIKFNLKKDLDYKKYFNYKTLIKLYENSKE